LDALASAVIGVPGKGERRGSKGKPQRYLEVSRGFATPHGALSTVLAGA